MPRLLAHPGSSGLHAWLAQALPCSMLLVSPGPTWPGPAWILLAPAGLVLNRLATRLMKARISHERKTNNCRSSQDSIKQVTGMELQDASRLIRIREVLRKFVYFLIKSAQVGCSGGTDTWTDLETILKLGWPTIFLMFTFQGDIVQ